MKGAIISAMSFLTAVLRIVLRRSNIIFATIVTLFLVVTGPFQTHLSLSPPILLLYWGGLVFAGQFVGVAVRLLLRAHAPQLGPYRDILLSAVGMTVIFSPPAYLWTWALVTPLDGSLMGFHWFVANVFIISSFIFAAREIIVHHMIEDAFARGESGALTTQGRGPAVLPRLMARLPQDDPGPVRRIEALDHFVAVVTPRATHHLRLRFADAVAEMDGAPGLVTHRSHWVRRDQIACTEKEGGRLFLILSCGTRIPVSRRYRPLVEEALELA